MRSNFGVDIKIDRSRSGFLRRRRRNGGSAALIIVLAAVAGIGWLLLQTRLGDGPSFSSKSATARPTVVVTPTRSVDEFLRAGTNAESSGTYRSAMAALDQASRRRPSDAALHSRIARLHVFVNELVLGEQRARKAVALDPQNAAAHAALCMTLDRQKRYDEAEVECDLAVQLAPDLVLARAVAAELSVDRGDFDAAQKHIDAALQREPNNTDVLRAQGYMHYIKGDFDAALAAWRHALDVNPNLPIVLVDIAKVYIMWAWASANATDIYSNADAAIELLRAAVAIDDRNAEAYERLGEAYRIRGEFGKAAVVLDKSVELDSTRPTAFTRRGVLRFQQYAFLQAIDDFTMALSLTKQISGTLSATDYTFLGYSQQLAGRCSEARTTMNSAIELFPGDGSLVASAQEIDGRCAGQ